jgi:peptide/nickel transport system substrate-binding protein
VTGDHYTLERFDDYWGGPAKTKTLTMSIVPEAGQRTIMLETGEIDAAYEIPYVDAEKIKENKDLQFLSTPSMKIVMFYVDCTSDLPINNKLVRQAMEYAIDKQAIVDTVCYGYGKVADAVVPDSVFEYKKVENPHTYNVEKAKELMKEAGAENGFKIDIWTPGTQTNTEVCQVVQDQLSAIGITSEIMVQDANTIDARQHAGDHYGLSLHFFSCNSGHAEYTLSNILPTGTMRNNSRFSSQEYDDAYYKWLETTDETQRAADQDVCHPERRDPCHSDL